MYRKGYGIIETLAPLHVGATAGEESGNLNPIFRDSFLRTGIIPGSSLRGRFRSQMRLQRQIWLEKALKERKIDTPDSREIKVEGEKEPLTRLHWLQKQATELKIEPDLEIDENFWYGKTAATDASDTTSEAMVKFEYASLLWLPVFCPGQPIVWVSSPKLLKRYQRLAGESVTLKDGKKLKEISGSQIDRLVYSGSQTLKALNVEGKKKLFFNFGFLELAKGMTDLSAWFPLGEELPAVVVADDEIGAIHDMALYRQSRVRLKDDEKRVDGGGFFNTEALPEGTIMVFPVAIRQKAPQHWQPFGKGKQISEIYLGGLESIGFGNCEITLKGM
ncbi:RAMP superfamily CRISPR-associated protein [Merismopedia glauca]|uniref:Type III-B CRISPR module RAMP protein Cmr4 n=1 Tax=Merismopedia glauca CCAP 1448/3 TaxID=1296344 RepID=A0A2T1BX26_9CYAN|nr:RAMP superfamily CRISPR-associated protein [Merismopedia glauca]PSB00565.1 type III-B CRISPR module RAMP protein Cmr4 [Merismopedia glauca CCAP 1448/3]